MVSEVARDIEITIDPAQGYRVAQVYGVPQDILTRAPDGSVTAMIGSAFLSNNGGGIYASLMGASDAVSPADVSVTYTDMRTKQRRSDRAKIASLDASPAPNLCKAHLLVDQFATITNALDDWHNSSDPWAAQASLAELSSRIDASRLDGMAAESELVASLRDKAGKLASLASSPAYFKPRRVVGDWKVLTHRGVDDISRGDFVTITDDGEFITERGRGPNAGDEIYQEYEINERQIHIIEGRLVMDYIPNGNRLRLRNYAEGTMILLERNDS